MYEALPVCTTHITQIVGPAFHEANKSDNFIRIRHETAQQVIACLTI